MDLPVMPPVSPMLAKSVNAIPPDASYEPKWDGFRSICFRDGDEVELGSRNERPMTRYFPELVAAVIAELPQRCVIDGEIVIATDHGLDWFLVRGPTLATRSTSRRQPPIWRPRGDGSRSSRGPVSMASSPSR
jgi:ATP-dependent DNA ligase